MFLLLISFFIDNLQASSQLKDCFSSQQTPITHVDFSARESGLKKKILVFGGIHGDEEQSQTLVWEWIKRLEKIKTPSNFWRIVPELNPDGHKLKTRTNANKVDINRNFPTKDWDELATKEWKNHQKSNPRRFPGASAGSEAETICAISHIEDFKPDLVVSIHTPYGLFDFDGPSDKRIKTKLLPWKRLGTFPGSLGRYLWDERKIPTLTIELRPESLEFNLGGFLLLQDQLTDLIE